MPRKRTIVLTASQIALGGSIGLASGWLCRLIVELLLWRGLIGDRVQHGFWVGLLLLISFGVTYGIALAGVAEGVIFAGRRFGVSIDRKRTYQGAGLPWCSCDSSVDVTAEYSLGMHWLPSNLLFYILLNIAQLLALIISPPPFAFY